MLKRMILVGVVLALVVGVVNSIGVAAGRKTPSHRPATRSRIEAMKSMLKTPVENCDTLKCLRRYVKALWYCWDVSSVSQYGGYAYGGTTTTALDFDGGNPDIWAMHWRFDLAGYCA